jgi:hypothetical protein
MDDLQPFDSCKLLIVAAKKSISEFDAACKSFIDGCAYTIIDYLNPNTGEKIKKLRFKEKIPGTVRVEASRILNDLRHALDQAACDGAIQLGRSNARAFIFHSERTPAILTQKSRSA